MNHTAYLLLALDTAANPPVALGIGVYSEATPTAKLSTWFFEIARAEAPSYEAARRALLQQVATRPDWAWLKRLLPARAPVIRYLGAAQPRQTARRRAWTAWVRR